jgi:hypothetical protein
MVWRIEADTSGRCSPGLSAPDDNAASANARGGIGYDGWVVTPLTQGRPMPHPERVPTKAVLWSTRSRYPNVMPIYGQLGVCDAFRDIVEEFEPGVHEFFPIEICEKPDGPAVVRYHILNICNRLQSVVFDDAVIVRETGLPGDRARVWALGTPGRKLSFHKAAITGKHLWRDSGALVWKFMSDELAAALDRHRFTGWVKREHLAAV